MNEPGYEEFKEAWVQYSAWKRVPTCGRAKASEEFEEWYEEKRQEHGAIAIEAWEAEF